MKDPSSSSRCDNPFAQRLLHAAAWEAMPVNRIRWATLKRRLVLPSELRMPAAHGDIVEKDVAAGMSARRRDRLIELEPGAGVGTSFHHQQCRTRRELVDPGDRAVGAYGWKSIRFVEEFSAGKRRRGVPGDFVRAVLIGHPLPLFG